MNAKVLYSLLVLALLTTAALVACTQTQPITEDELFIRKADMEATVTEPAPEFTTAYAGESQPAPPAFYGAPPTIPHDIADMWVSREYNDCLDCHELGDADTPAIPPSHRIKAQMESPARTAARGPMVTEVESFYKVSRVSGERFNCLQCHAPQAENADLLVDNTFTPDQPDDTNLKDVLEGLNEKGEF